MRSHNIVGHEDRCRLNPAVGAMQMGRSARNRPGLIAGALQAIGACVAIAVLAAGLIAVAIHYAS